MIFRGAIYEIRVLPGARGHEQQGRRLAVIIQSDRFATSTVTVAMTSTSAGHAIYRPEIDVDGTTARVLTDQIYTVDPSPATSGERLSRTSSPSWIVPSFSNSGSSDSRCAWIHSIGARPADVI